jgi:phage baseplate assembly protein W
MQIAYPVRVDARGRTADTNDDRHIRDMIEQILFTAPGERVNRPDFGTGIEQLVFALNNDELATTTQFLVQGALEQWLGEVIIVNAVEVESLESSLQITIVYIVRRTQEQRIEKFFREV